ncbi:hypothetical protein CHS0354_010135 [Potamilus streckersoni]|uniref:Uncharacterized protein n=1 Tax=Potamilus streckersoni TaxID=2493646 RepID=A0AAE0RSF9_9BIVA|nr:hypothetical protein CHS0354_010135 [Potamilus streckersoni]
MEGKDNLVTCTQKDVHANIRKMCSSMLIVLVIWETPQSIDRSRQASFSTRYVSRFLESMIITDGRRYTSTNMVNIGTIPFPSFLKTIHNIVDKKK